MGKVHGVRGGDGAQVAGGPSIDASWEGSGCETALGNHGPWRVDTYLQYGIPDHQGTAELPRQGVSGTGNDQDGNAGSFLPPECLEYHHHFGGGKHLLPTVPLM